MLSALPKIADKNFVIGFFLPALLGVIAIAWLFPDVSLLAPFRNLSASDKKIDDLVYQALCVWVLAVILMTANFGAYRLLEGYLPPTSWCFPLLWWQRRRFLALKARDEALTEEWKRAIKTKTELSAAKQRKIAHLRLKLMSAFPPSLEDVLPTRFGNTIRAFEFYPLQAYGADGIPVWLRLASVIPKEFAALIDDARAQVDFFVNTACLASIIAGVELISSVHNKTPDAIRNWPRAALNDPMTYLWPFWEHHLTLAVASLAVAFLAYHRSIARARAWGDLVKSAFDCYLPALVKQMGYAMPSREADRRDFWTEFNALILYQQPMTADRWRLAGASNSKDEEHDNT